MPPWIAAPPRPVIGSNATMQPFLDACPSRKYQRCFLKELDAKYPVTQYRIPKQPQHCMAARGYIGTPAVLSAKECTYPPAEHALVHVGGHPLQLCPAAAPPPASRPTSSAPPLRCGSSAAAMAASGVVLLLGVPSSPTATGVLRRAAIRASWLQDERVGRSVVVCFLLSSRTPAAQMAPMREEHKTHGDLLFLDAPETPWLITENTKYSGFLRKGRGMPTFKQYAFFQWVAAAHPEVPFSGKIDDDTAPNLRVLVPFLERLRCAEPDPMLFIGAINWASYVPRSADFGVRGDRCGFGWSLQAALSNFGASFGTPGTPGYIEACDSRGGVLPFPYGTGAGYLFSAALLRFLASSAEVTGWVADAAGPTHEALQWQKFEDTSTGYFVSHSPRTVRYVDIGPLVHDVFCHVQGERKRRGGGTYRPPTNVSLFVHNLKGPTAFAFAWEHMQATTLPYDHERCVTQVHRNGRTLGGGGGGGGRRGRGKGAGGRRMG